MMIAHVLICFQIISLVASAKVNTSLEMPPKVTATMPRGLKELTIPTFTHYGGLILPMGPICTEGIRIALDAIQRTSLLADYDLSIKMYDEKCDHGVGIKLVTQHLINASSSSENFLPLIIGPACAENAHTGHVLKYYETVGLVDLAPVRELATERKRFSNFATLQPSFETYYDGIPAFIASNGWSKVYLLSELYLYWAPFEEKLEYNLYKLNITLAGTSKVILVPGELPAPEHFEMAVREFAKSGTRIVILHTSFSGMIACWLYRYGLYGPGYVYIFYGIVYFLPNSMLRDAECTDQMLADVLPSIIHFSFGTPMSLDPENAKDVVGMTGSVLEATLKERIEQPEITDKWWFWRSHCYSQTVGAALVLNATERDLNKQNDTLGNWLTNGENFQRRGKEISKLLRKNLDTLQYNGLNTYPQQKPNSLIGVTGFFQMQLIPSSKRFEAIPVATFDSSLPNASIIRGPGKYVWRTKHNVPPFDSLRTFYKKEPIIGQVEYGVLDGLAVFLIIVNLAIMVVVYVKRTTDVVSLSLPLLNCLVLIGNTLVLSFILIMPANGGETAHQSCMASAFVVLTGFSLLTGSMLAKMYVANVALGQNIVTMKDSVSTASIANNNSAIASTIGRIGSLPRRLKAARSISNKRKDVVHIPIPNTNTFDLSKTVNKAFKICLAWTILQVTLMTIWFANSPVSVGRFERSYKVDEISVAYQSYTEACLLELNSENLGFLGTLLVMYGLVLLRSLFMAYYLRKVVADEVISDLHAVRTASYSIGLMFVAGAAAIWLFFKEDPGDLHVATSALALMISAASTLIVFGQTVLGRILSTS